MIGQHFRCGDPRTLANSTRGYLHRNGTRYPQCALCKRIKTSARFVDRVLARWKHGPKTIGQKIAEDLL